MKQSDDRARGQRGFTILEIIAVIVLLGAMTAVVVSTFPSQTENEFYSRLEVIKDHIRYAQLKSIKEDRVFGVSCDGDNYWMFRATRPVNPLADPIDPLNQQPFANEGAAVINLSGAGFSLDAFTVFFDEMGEPYTAYVDTNNAGNVRLTANLDVDFEISSTATSETITITPFTGYVP